MFFIFCNNAGNKIYPSHLPFTFNDLLAVTDSSTLNAWVSMIIH